MGQGINGFITGIVRLQEDARFLYDPKTGTLVGKEKRRSQKLLFLALFFFMLCMFSICNHQLIICLTNFNQTRSIVLTVFGYFNIYVDTSTKGEMIVGKTFVNCQV